MFLQFSITCLILKTERKLHVITLYHQESQSIKKEIIPLQNLFLKWLCINIKYTFGRITFNNVFPPFNNRKDTISFTGTILKNRNDIGAPEMNLYSLTVF